MTRERIGLVACCGQKRLGRYPAEEIYQSPLFRKSRQWVLDHCTRWFIMSAKYGLLAPDVQIETYDLTLNTLDAASRRAWAKKVRAQLEPLAHESFVALAGERYCAALTDLHVERPLAGMGIGKQLHFLTCQNALTVR